MSSGSRRVAYDVDHTIGGQRRAAEEAEGSHDVNHIDAAIARLASGQDGVATRGQLLALGLRRRGVEHRVRTGRLIIVHRGVYAVGHSALSDRARARAGLLAAGDNAVLSHRTAAAVWRLTQSMPQLVEVTVTTRARRSRPGLRIHETTRDPSIRIWDGFPVTAPLRTLVDLAASRDRDRLCSEALVLKLVTEGELERAGLLRADVAPTRSWLERRFLALMRDARLPRPLVNTVIGSQLVDFAWPDARVVVETDGWGAHGGRAAFESDHRRDALLESLGWHVLRFTWRQLRDDPMLVVAVVAQTLARRAAPGAGSPTARDLR